MAENRGKSFEGIIQNAFENVKGMTIDRLHDQTNGFKGSTNICDFIAYYYPHIFYLECKSCHNNTFPLSNITEKQWNGLLEKSNIPGVVSGVIVWWVDRDVTRFIPITELDFLVKMSNIKSIRYDTSAGVEIPGKKKRVFFDYDIKKFLKELFYGQSR